MLQPEGVPSGFSVYASREETSGSTTVLVLNKRSAAARLALAFETRSGEELEFPAESITLVTFVDAGGTAEVLRYTKDRADAGLPPERVQ